MLHKDYERRFKDIDGHLETIINLEITEFSNCIDGTQLSIEKRKEFNDYRTEIFDKWIEYHNDVLNLFKEMNVKK